MKTKPYIGGWKSIFYSFHVAHEVGYDNFYKSITSKNTCKTCAYGMGGQNGGMTNEAGHGLEICKKSIQAQLTDIQPGIKNSFFKENTITQIQQIRPRELERLGRLNQVLYKQKGDSNYSVIDWPAAFEIMEKRFKSTTANRSFFYSSGRSSNEAAFLVHLFARLYGTNNVNNCSYYCHQASGVGMGSTLGTGTATVALQDIKKADLIFVIGANPASNHPRFITELMHCRRRGGKVVVINPLMEPGLQSFAIPSDIRSFLSTGSEIASHYIQPKIGSDAMLLAGIAKKIIETKTENTAFLNNYTENFEAYLSQIKSTTWQEIIDQTGLSQAKIEEIATLYANSKNTVFSWAMGITHHAHGVQNVEAIVHLALLRGMLGRPGAGLLPLRGHSNVQGVGSMGLMPTLKNVIFENIESHFKVKLPTTKGWDTMACMAKAKAGEVDVAFLMGGNLYGSNPDLTHAEAALNNIPFKVFLNTTINQGHVFGVDQEVLILPVLARDEEPQKTTQESMFNFVRLSDGGPQKLGQCKSEVEILVQLAKNIVPVENLDFNQFAEFKNVRQAIAKIIPGFDALATIDETKTEFQIPGRTKHNMIFDTPTGKAKFNVNPLVIHSNNSFRLMTIRSEGQFNSIIYDEDDAWRGQTERDIVLMNAQDMAHLNIAENDLVTLKNNTGTLPKLKAKAYNIAQGCLAGYYPETNILVPIDLDPRSLTPSFKNVAVEILR